MGKIKDLTGQKFGELTALHHERKGKRTYWVCECSCGRTVSVLRENLVRGKSKSCGHEGGYKNTKKAIHKFKTTEMVEGTALCKLTQKVRSDSTTGVKGVKRKKNGLYVVEICVKGQHYYVGCTKDLEKAIKMRKDAEERLFYPILKRYGRDTE